MSDLRTQVTGGSEDDPQYLADIGITIGSGLEISFDTSEFNSALESNPEGVEQLFDGVMAQFLSTLEPFTTQTSASNTIDLYKGSINTKIENIDERIERMEGLLRVKEEMLTRQYSALYIQNVQFNQQQLNMVGIYSSFSATA